MNPSEHHAGLLFEQITIDLVAADEGDATLPFLTVTRDFIELRAGLLDLRRELTFRLQATLADIGMVQEIRDSETCRCIERQGNQDCAGSGSDHHALILAGHGKDFVIAFRL